MDQDLLDEVAYDFIRNVRDHSLDQMRMEVLGAWPDNALYRSLADNGFTPAQIEVLWTFVMQSTDNALGFFLKYIDVITARGQLKGELRTREGQLVGPLTEIYEMDKLFDFEWRERFGRFNYEAPIGTLEDAVREDVEEDVGEEGDEAKGGA